MSAFRPAFRLIASGTISQDHPAFGESRNTQCVCISVTTCVFVQNVNRIRFTPEIIDRLITHGDTYYKKTKRHLGSSHRHNFLNPDEVAPVVEILNIQYNVETTWEACGLYPATIHEVGPSSEYMVGKLDELFSDHPQSPFVFLGLHVAVSFWKTDGDYLLFDSHSTDNLGRHCHNGVGRIFCFDNMNALAKFFLLRAPFDGISHQYEITRINSSIRPAISPSGSVIRSGSSSSLDDLPLADRVDIVSVSSPDAVTNAGITGLKRKSDANNSSTSDEIPSKVPKVSPIVSTSVLDDPKLNAEVRIILEDISGLISNETSSGVVSKTPKVGRPKKKPRGRPRIKRDPPSDAAFEKDTGKTSDSTPKENPVVNIVDEANITTPTPQRRNPQLIAEYSGNQLLSLKQYRLKNTSLRASSCYRCPHCSAPLFEEERGKVMWCCGAGKYNILNLRPLDAAFYEDVEFLRHPRLYNDIFSFCALTVPQGYHHLTTGLSFIKIQGRTYHRVFDISWKGTNPNNSFLYIDDGEARLALAEGKRLVPQIVRRIQTFINQINPYPPYYKRLFDEPSDEAHLVFEVTSRRTHGPTLGEHPQSTEVAAVISCETAEFNPSRVCIWKKGDARPHYIDYFNALVEPFQYPLLYPEGTPGWHIGRTDNMGNKISQLRYIRCLVLSEERFSIFGPLSETWMVDMYARIEEERLRYLRSVQICGRRNGGMRTAPFDEVEAAVENQNDPALHRNPVVSDITTDETIQGDGPVTPGRIYLPNTFTGGPRYMRTSYMNAMALVSRLGGPTYFLTFTAFGGWDEIKDSKHPRSKQSAQVVCRVFHLKLQELIRDIKDGKFFGAVAYVVWVIEFQMRGLPHAHICFRIKGGGPTQSADIDRVIRADVPRTDELELRALVLKHMRHGPCGEGYRTDLPCWDPELRKCKKFFPKPHNETTFVDDRGFVHYRRNEMNKVEIPFRGKTFVVDDRWIVPYCAALLKKYGCHVNLEIASLQRVVKYLFKYISKGPPLRRLTVVLNSDGQVDEVEDYVTKRYIGASDAAWRILGYPMTGKDPTVKQLPVHLEGKQSVYFIAGQERQAVNSSTSLLLLYFNRPIRPDMNGLTYIEFYEQFIVHPRLPNGFKSVEIIPHNDGVHFITPRQRGECVARMFWVAPSRGEQYYLRMLLSKYPCRGYLDLKALGGPTSLTFQQAARAVGLADDRREYFQAMEEASQFMRASRLRLFFVMLLTIGCQAPDMWEQFKKDLCEDFLVRFPGDEEKSFKLGLIHIDRCLRKQGSSLLEVGLPDVKDDCTELGRERLMFSSAAQARFVEEWEEKLSPDQLMVLGHIRTLMRPDGNASGIPRALFLDGPGGYGKTLLLQVIAAFVRSLDKVVLCVASSGIAALNLPGGSTAHSLFRLPLKISDCGYWSITNGSQRAEVIREAALIIFDEAPMAHKHVIEMLDRSLRDLMNSDVIFGGKVVIFAGDFRQIPPVVEKARGPSDIINCSIRGSHLWNLVECFSLTTPHRITDGGQFSRFLLQLGNGTAREQSLSESNDSGLFVALPNIKHVTTVPELVDFVFPSDVLREPNLCAKRVILSTLNSNVKNINALVLESLEGEVHELYSVDSIAEDEGDHLDIDDSMLHYTQGKGVPDHVLKLKVGCICFVMRNLNFDLRLVNGTKVVVVAISRKLITCRCPESEELFGIPRISFKFPILPGNPIEMVRRQFPLQLCFAMTVHKSQGQTIDIVGLDLRSDCFTHGQLYVALSRVRSIHNMCVLVNPNRVKNNTAYARNIVYKELL